MHEPVLEVTDLVKFYGSFQALDHVSFNVFPGSIFGFLGQNGAGKTSTIRAILGLARPDGGSVRLFGRNPSREPTRVFDRVGYSPELPTLQGFLTADELLDFTAKQYGLSRQSRRTRIQEVLELVGLLDHRRKKIGKYSKGMVQRLVIAQALLNDPELVIMDEPTLGLDPAATVHFRDLFQRLVRDQKTLLLSSHQLDEVQRIATHIAMIHRGRIVFQGNLDEVLTTYSGARLIDIELQSVPPSLLEALRTRSFVRNTDVMGNRLTIQLADDSDRRGELSDFLFHQGATILGFTQRNMRLEEAYLGVLKGGGASSAA